MAWRIVAITGVPGTGKTTLAAALARHGFRVVALGAFAHERGLDRERDLERDSNLVDMDSLASALAEGLATERGPVIVEGHYAHEMDVDGTVLLRADPQVLIERLTARGWTTAKVRENVEVEALDILAGEVIASGLPARELDATHLRVPEAAAAVESIIREAGSGPSGQPMGTAAWPLQTLAWL